MAQIVWTRRVFKLLAFALLITVTCIGLGIWQIARLHQKQQYNAAVRAGLADEPEPITALVSGEIDPASVRYRRTEATGTYDVGQEIVLYGRSRDGQAGNHLLTPLVMDDGSAVIVDRGWVPVGVSAPGMAEAAPPDGPVRVDGVLFASEGGVPGSPGTVSAAETTVSRIDLERIQAQLPYPIAPVYLLLQEQSPAQASALPLPATLPTLSEGPHLSYAVQWFTFATIAVIGFLVLAFRERREQPEPSEAAPR